MVGTEATDTPHDDSVERFAADLKKLRVAASAPTYDRLHNATGISKSVLWDAFAGKSLPSARTVAGIAEACDGDQQPGSTAATRWLSAPRPRHPNPLTIRPPKSPPLGRLSGGAQSSG